MLRPLLHEWARYVVAGPGLGLLALYALIVRSRAPQRARRGSKPRLVYGPVPIINIKYMSRAMAQQGYVAKTFVSHRYDIHVRADFDYYVADRAVFRLVPQRLRGRVIALMGPYVALLWALPRFDIFHFFFDGGFLQDTPLQFLEVQLLHLAGKKIVVMPYG